MKKRFLNNQIILLLISLIVISSCNSNQDNKKDLNQDDLSAKKTKNTALSKDMQQQLDTSIRDSSTVNASVQKKEEKPKVIIYNFHLTNRCLSCRAIEMATEKTLQTYFAKEVKEGRVKIEILNVDDDANKDIAEKYEASGSALFVTRIFKEKETIKDLTGEGFKFARTKEARFIELLKKQIEEYLKIK
ncbi:MAG: hypothetical protein A2X12_01455 [Bacteroidetes bacterium GWE2_29_8]|nr:MAG: hypothetical protein A2X12_01455 [Bacteroidetes bacterium GWE2_29_8]OFY23386.1 MAG: hypothetical protein A2X02_08780 [Bacteroidetes bacterium GWF2_29_10]